MGWDKWRDVERPIPCSRIYRFVRGAAHGKTCNSDNSGDGLVDGEDLGILLSEWGACSRSIDSVTNNCGGIPGGTLITIIGRGLSTTSAVLIGGVHCTSLQALASKVVTAVTPAGAAGQVAIEVSSRRAMTTGVCHAGAHHSRAAGVARLIPVRLW
ncbi:MAG: hypothetical protein EXS03_09790, partial [Phycisphaerales bacterium]|nr:hypothetical protein [Phycisphaerales bacterium]